MPKSADSARVVAVAYSGGRDSTALLHATLAAGLESGVRVLALHVHHGLSALADDWARHCLEQCDAWSAAGWPVHLEVQRLTHRPSRGESIEAWARQARYAALREMAVGLGSPVVLLGHHRRDQAETLMIQALRGAGPAGLGAMPKSAFRDGVTWLRPWLHRSREDIDHYVQLHSLPHIEDDSNTHTRFTRNRLRLQVWPAVIAAFPQAEAALATSAARSAEAADALAELAQMDLAACAGDSLHIDRWLTLSPARRSNSLRSWLKAQIGDAVPASIVLRLLAELPESLSGSRWQLACGELRCHRRQLRYQVTQVDSPRQEREVDLVVHRASIRALPGWGGRLQFARVEEGGVPLAGLGRLELRERRGSEQFQAGPGRPPRSLKKQFQAAGVPEWDRRGPLVYSGGQLIYVPGLGMDARAVGVPGQSLMTLHWLPDASD